MTSFLLALSYSLGFDANALAIFPLARQWLFNISNHGGLELRKAAKHNSIKNREDIHRFQSAVRHINSMTKWGKNSPDKVLSSRQNMA